MVRQKAWALAWLLAAALSALLTQGPSAQGDELLANGGFEDGVDPWTVGGGALDATAGLRLGYGQYALPLGGSVRRSVAWAGLQLLRLRSVAWRGKRAVGISAGILVRSDGMFWGGSRLLGRLGPYRP